MTDTEQVKNVAVVLMAQTVGVLYSASREGTLGLACAWVNYSRLQRFYCNCVNEHDTVYYDSLSGKSGCMCANCCGIVSQNGTD